jgi:hypothetical protein
VTVKVVFCGLHSQDDSEACADSSSLCWQVMYAPCSHSHYEDAPLTFFPKTWQQLPRTEDAPLSLSYQQIPF